MQIFEYENKEKKEKARAIDIMSLLETMSELEEFNGVTSEKITDNWYEIKRQLRSSLVAKAEKR